MRKIKQNDDVIVLVGKDKGQRGTVLSVASDGRVIVEGINMAKRHTKPNPNAEQPGGIIHKEMPIQISNVALVNPGTNKADRIGFKVLDDGRKVRYFKSNGEVVDV